MNELKTMVSKRIRRYLENGPKSRIDIVRHLALDADDIEYMLDFMAEHKLLKTSKSRFSNSIKYSI